MVDIYKDPIMNVSDASTYLAIPKSTLGGWSREDVIHTADPVRRGWPNLPFVGVVEAFVLGRLNQMGIPRIHIRDTANTVRERLGDPYGLARPGLGVNGRDILITIGEEYYRGSDLQQAVSEAVLDFKTLIEWSGNDPQRLRLQHFGGHVILDPRFGWGAPVVETNKVPVEAIMGLYVAKEPLEDIAAEFDMEPGDVDAIIRDYVAGIRRAA